MPRSKIEPYVPIAQTFNDDPESWELTDLFGPKSIRTFIEILRIAECTDNHWRLVSGWQSTIGRKARQSPKTVQGIVGWMLARGWLSISQILAEYPPGISQILASDPPDIGQLLASGWPVILRSRNYQKFHKVNVPGRLEDGFEYVFPHTLHTLHPLRTKKEEEYYNITVEEADTERTKTGNQLNGSQSVYHQHAEQTEQPESERKRLFRLAGIKDPDEDH